MKFYLDSADLSKVAAYLHDYALSGATSNPSILYKDHCQLADFLQAVPADKVCFAQVIQKEYAGILEDAHQILQQRGDTVIKVPASKDGLRAITQLKAEGVKTLATAIYSAQQALLAANCGADYVAPYVNRMCDLELDGVEIALQIQHALRIAHMECEVVAASFKNLKQVKDLLVGGIDAVTVPMDLFEKLLTMQSTRDAVDQFEKDWYALTGTNKL